MNSSPLHLIDLSNRGCLKITGADRIRFLNGQTTNDIKRLSEGRGCFAYFTNNKGKIRSDAVILNTGHALFLDLEPGMETKLSAELEKFIIADDVLIESATPPWKVFTLIGTQAHKAAESLPLPQGMPKERFEMKSLESDGSWRSFCYLSHRATDVSFDFWLPLANFQPFFELLLKSIQNLDGTIGSNVDLERARIEAGIPQFGTDLLESNLAPESGMEDLAISYKKGCYLGQEVISRIKSIGKVNRIVTRLSLPPGSAIGDKISNQDREMGVVTSVTQSKRFGLIGLAMLKREMAVPGTKGTSPQGEVLVLGSSLAQTP